MARRGKAPPWLPWWYGDYWGGTAHLCPEERLVYSELLVAQWANGGRLPNDVKELRRLARCESWTVAKFAKHWRGVQAVDRPTFEAKFTEDEGGLYNARLDDELRRAGGLRKARSEGGRIGALRRWGCPKCSGELDGTEAECPACGEDLAP